MIRYAITDRSRLAGDETARRIALFALARQWAEQQIEYIQLREKDLSAAELERIACAITASIRGLKSRTKLLLNSRADVALAAGADGVHLTAATGRLTPAEVRSLFARAIPDSSRPAPPVVSISCHTLDEVTRARNEQADLILFGPVFGKTVAGAEVTPAAGLDALRAACEAAGELPVLALGGVTEANKAACIAAGAAGIAGIRLFSDGPL